MKSFFIMIPYSIGKGRLSPSCARISASVCGVGLRPAMARAGSTPGVLKKMMNTSTVITNMTSTVHSDRRTMNVSTGSLLHSQLGPRVERVADAIAQDVQRQHGQHDHDARREGDPGPGVEQLLAVADDRTPADVGRLDPDGQERQA